MALAETRLAVVHKIARAIEDRVPSIALELRPQTTLEEAHRLDEEKRQFKESANHYYSVFIESHNPELRCKAVVGATQQLINLGRFRQARDIIGELHDPLMELPDRQRVYYKARAHEKMGWIEGYEFGYKESIHEFSKARQLLKYTSEVFRTNNEESLYSTTTHFLGRGYFGLAASGINKVDNIIKARDYFRIDLDRAERLREAGSPIPDNEGFQHAWIARCELLSGNIELAHYEVETARRLWEEHMDANPKSGIMAHYNLLRGKIDLVLGNPRFAESQFREAIKIRQKVESYPSGLANAYLGLADVRRRQGNWAAASRYFALAVKAHPYTLVASTFDG
jgi:tetratricopeptide (TPR) repeat protein